MAQKMGIAVDEDFMCFLADFYTEALAGMVLSRLLGITHYKREEIVQNVLLVSDGDPTAEIRLSQDLQEIPQVKNIISYVDTVGAEIPKEYLDEEIRSQLVSEQYSRMVLNVETDFEGHATFDLIEQIRNTAAVYYPDSYYLAGEDVSTCDLMDTILADTVKVNLIAIGAVFFVLLSMQSISLPVIPVLAIEAAIWINMAIPYFTGFTVFYIAYLIISSIQLGATVDYAILLTDWYMEFRQSMPKQQAVVRTVAVVTTSILTSGTVMSAVGFLLGGISSHGILSQLATFLGKGMLLSLISVFFVLPGHRTCPRKRRKSSISILMQEAG